MPRRGDFDGHTLRLFVSYFFYQGVDFVVSSRQIPDYYAPHPGWVDTVVGVCDNIPKPPHLIPGNALISSLSLVGQICGRLPDNFKGAFDGVPELSIVAKVIQVMAFGERLRIRHRLVNVGQILCLATGHDLKRR